MFSFHSPLWLILLLVIPLIRWLHRFRRQSGSIPGTTLFLWNKIKQHVDNDGTIGKPHRQWLLRALIASLFILSLSGPSLVNKGSRSVKIWLDDSLSMFAREDRHLRIQTALQQLQQYLVEHKPLQIQLHSLGDPALSLILDADDQSTWTAQLSKWASGPRGEPSPPPTAFLSPVDDHILITDGADKNLNQWAQTAPLHKLIQVGHTEQNIALTHLSLRQSLNPSGTTNGIAQIHNLSATAQKIRFVVLLKEQQDKQIIKTQIFDLPASGKKIIPFSTEAVKQGKLLARIEVIPEVAAKGISIDALPADNELQLDISKAFRAVRYRILGQCSRYVLAVLNSQASFLQTNKTADLLLDCTGQSRPAMLATLKLHPSGTRQRTRQTAHWHNSGHGNITTNSLRIAAGLAYNDSAPLLTANAIPLLSADKRLLIMKHPGEHQLIDCYIDTYDPAFTRQAEFPLILLDLIYQLIEQSPETAPLSISRDIDASRIKTMPLAITPVQQSEALTTDTSYTYLLLIIALLLLMLDFVLTFGLFHRFGKQH